jgi:acyl-CoA thioester hydrolase
MNWDYPTPFTNRVKVQKDDIDGLGHANNACYVVWCEQCAWKHSEALGLSVSDYHRLDRGVAINKADYEYFLPAFNQDELLVATWLTACDEKLRLERRFQIVNGQTGATVMRGHWLLICVTITTGKPTRFPQEFLNTYSSTVI